MMQFILTAGIWDSMPRWLATVLLSLLQLLDQVVYVLIGWMYRVFILVSEVDIFKDGTQLEAIVNRVYVIVGIAMLFIFAYNLILLIINPEGKQLGNMAKVIQNAIISVILIIFLPTIFSYLKIVQNHIVTQNVIGNIVLGTNADANAARQTNKKGGIKVALDIYTAFYHPVDESYVTCKNMCCPEGTTNCDGSACQEHICYDYVSAYHTAYERNNISDFVWNKQLRDGVKDGKVEYLGIISTVAGAFALWMFISFALDIGIRVGKLAFYEIISPIPVMMRILPGDKMFDKWFKGVKDTYLSIFVRLIIIYTCMYFITLVPDIFEGMWTSGDAGIIVALANVIIILGILQFAKDAPKLISDMFGGGAGGVKFGIKDKYKSLGRAFDTARAGVYGATTADAGGWNRFKGFMGGASRGARYGYAKGTERLDAIRDARDDGSTFSGRTLDRLRRTAGMKTRYDSIGTDVEKQLKKNRIEDREKHNQAFLDAVSGFKGAAEQITTGAKSNYRAGSIDAVIAGDKTYDLSGKNYYEMQEVIAAAERDNVSYDDVLKLKREMEKHKKSTIETIQTAQITGGTIDASVEQLQNLKNAHSKLVFAAENGAAETVGTDGNLVSSISLDDISDVVKINKAKEAVIKSNGDISEERHKITQKDNDEAAKKAKADRDYINKTSNSKDKK